MNVAERAGDVAAAAASLLGQGPATAELATRMAAASRWSLPMAEWILRATLEPLADQREVERWCPAAAARPDGRTIVVAGGPVPDPAVRSLAAAVLLGGSADLKVSRAEPVLAPAFAGALRHVGGFDVTVHDFRGDEDQAVQFAFYAGADRILAFGGRVALESIRALASPGCLFLGHGPRLSLGLVEDPYHDEGLSGLALDIARYDTRGCLSPQAVLVAGGDAERIRVIEHLGAGLDDLTQTLPPESGELADELAWRLRVDSVLLDSLTHGGVEAFHTDGESYMVHACRGDTVELSPGRRVVCVMAVEDLRAEAPRVLGAVRGLVQGLAIVGGPVDAWRGFGGAHHVAPAGLLQTPPLGLRPDGHDPFARP